MLSDFSSNRSVRNIQEIGWPSNSETVVSLMLGTQCSAVGIRHLPRKNSSPLPSRAAATSPPSAGGGAMLFTLPAGRGQGNFGYGSLTRGSTKTYAILYQNVSKQVLVLLILVLVHFDTFWYSVPKLVLIRFDTFWYSVPKMYQTRALLVSKLVPNTRPCFSPHGSSPCTRP